MLFFYEMRYLIQSIGGLRTTTRYKSVRHNRSYSINSTDIYKKMPSGLFGGHSVKCRIVTLTFLRL